MNKSEYCPRCGAHNLQPVPGGINEYDSRKQTLPRHNSPSGDKCPETTTTLDALNFIAEWKRRGVEPSVEWAHFKSKSSSEGIVVLKLI